MKSRSIATTGNNRRDGKPLGTVPLSPVIAAPSRLMAGVKRRVSRLSSHCKARKHDTCYMQFCTCACHQVVDPNSLRARLPKHTWPLARLVLRAGPAMRAIEAAQALKESHSAFAYQLKALLDATGMDTRRELWEFLDSRRAELKFLEEEAG